MEIKSREPLSVPQWLKEAANHFYSHVGGRAWVFLFIAVCAVLLAFYAGVMPHIRQPVIQFVKPIVTLDIFRVDKYIKGKLASPRRIQIDVKHTNYQKLRFKRDEAFSRGIIVTTDDSYVPARVTVDGQSYRVSMRLKGDYPDHLTGDKWSFRINVKGENAIWGMKRFSIQDPQRSGWLKEWVMYEWFRYEDLIALRYDFVDVTVNGRDLGIFAIEESFGKELIEYNQRTEGPILKFDESLLIDSSATNRGDRESQTDVYYVADITSFNTSKTMKTEKLRKSFLAGRALLNQLRSRQKSLSDVMDVERAARTFAILDILAGYHSIRWKNSRFYYNPITARIELIAYNMYGPQANLSTAHRIAYQYWLDGTGLSPYHVNEWVDVFFSDEKFVKAYFDALDRMVSPGYLEEFFESISVELTENTHVLYVDGSLALTPVEDYLANRDAVYELLHPKVPLKAYLKNFDDQSGDLTLTVANTSFLPVRFEAVECQVTGKSYNGIEPIQLGHKIAGSALDFVGIEVSGIASEDRICALDVSRAGDNDVIEGLRLRYKILGADESRWAKVDVNSIDLAWELFPRSPNGTDTIVATAPGDMLRIDEISREISIQPGYWVLTQDIVFPSGYLVVGAAGTTVVLNEGAALISFSPLQLTGSADAPFVVRSDDGSGQGIAVLGAGEQSAFSHVVIKENSSISRGPWSLTGTVTFFESDVKFANVYLENNTAEDMANFIRSNYSIRDTRFVGSAFDSLDVDFGDGSIESSFFSDCGNDCIDLSGSRSTISAVDINGAGDKGVSVGEQSHVDIIDSQITNTNVGVASKDGSKANIKTLTMHDVVTGLSSYQKKPEFSGATLKSTDVVFGNTENPYFVEQGSTIVHDGKSVNATARP